MPTIRISTNGQAPTRAAGPGERRASPAVRLRVMLIGIGTLLVPLGAQATDPKPARPDSEFLEFLGSGDDVDQDLRDYLVKQHEVRSDDAKPAPTRAGGKT
jgi:hypothetical protein